MAKNYSPAREESSALFLQSAFEDIIKTEVGMNNEFSVMFAAAMVRGLRDRVGGQRIYIPKVPANGDRDALIRREYNGTNAKEQCKKWNLSRSRLYQILNQPKQA